MDPVGDSVVGRSSVDVVDMIKGRSLHLERSSFEIWRVLTRLQLERGQSELHHWFESNLRGESADVVPVIIARLRKHFENYNSLIDGPLATIVSGSLESALPRRLIRR